MCDLLKGSVSSNLVANNVEREEEQVQDIVKKLHMNELEVALWTLWINKTRLHSSELPTDKYLLYTAFQIKVHYNQI